jgi:hypothetical protein
MRSSLRSSARPRMYSWWLITSAMVACALVLFGCSIGGSTTGSGGSTTGGGGGSTTGGAPTATPTPPPHALAWFQMDGANVGQIWASVNGGSAHQVTHMAPVSGDCVRDQHWSPPVFSPDLSHIVGGWGSGACGDGPEQGDLYTVVASSGAATAAGGACFHNIRLSLRQTGWVNNSTIWWIDGQHVYTQPLGGACATLGTIASSGGSSYAFAEDAVLRGNTLFFEVASGSSGSTTTSYTLRRFDMTTHAVLGGSISLGSGNPCICSRNDAGSPGFDVSADGAHIVYQKATPVASGGDQEGVASSKFYYANADGSGATQIAACGTAKSFARMQLAPNGNFVAVARALPAPSVFTASVTSGGACADPNMKFYNPSAYSYPVWKWDNTTFWASTKEIAEVYPPTTGAVEHFDFGVAAGSVGVAGGANPWYTIGA